MISMIDLDQARERREAQIRQAALRRQVARLVPVDPPVHRSRDDPHRRARGGGALTVAGPATLTPGQRPTHPEVPYDHRRP